MKPCSPVDYADVSEEPTATNLTFRKAVSTRLQLWETVASPSVYVTLQFKMSWVSQPLRCNQYYEIWGVSKYTLAQNMEERFLDINKTV